MIVSVYNMTPETADGRGSVPLVGDGKVPGVGVAIPGHPEELTEPVRVNDVPAVGPGQ